MSLGSARGTQYTVHKHLCTSVYSTVEEACHFAYSNDTFCWRSRKMSDMSTSRELILDIDPPVMKLHEPLICGGRADSQPADAEIQRKVNLYRQKVEEQHGKLSEYTAVSYQLQMVNGTNCYVKVRVAPEKHVEVVFWEPFGDAEKKETGRTLTSVTAL